MSNVNSIIGCLLGSAVGDALGLPYENLLKCRQSKLYPNYDQYHFFFGKGMFSDDTEHTIMVAQSLIKSNRDIIKFSKIFAWKLRFWILGLPAGIGFATLKAIIKLWLFHTPAQSGIFSAGNGPAMRAPILGVHFKDDINKIKPFINISTRITHTDPKAELGALLIAFTAYISGTSESNIPPQEYFQKIKEFLKEYDSEDLIKWLLKRICGYSFFQVVCPRHDIVRFQRLYKF